MSFEAESNSELTVIVPAYQLHFWFPVQNKIHKQKNLSDTRTGILGSITGPCDFLPALSDGPMNLKKSAFRIKFRWCKWSIEPKRYVNEDKIKYKSFINQVNCTGSGVYFTCWKILLTKFNFKNYKRKYNIFLV